MPTIQESLLILVAALLLMVYIGGIMSLKHPVMGVVIPQFFIGVLPVLACIYIKGNARDIFSLKLPRAKGWAGAFCMYVGAGSLTLLVSNLLSMAFPDGSQGLNEEYMAILDGIPFVPALLLIALTPAVCEELLFRGYMFTAFKQKMSLTKAICFVSVLFGISHMSLIKLIPTALLGAALAYTMNKADSIFASALIHFLNNGLSVFILYYGSRIAFLNNEQMGVPFMLGLAVLSVIFIPVGVKILNYEKIDRKERTVQ